MPNELEQLQNHIESLENRIKYLEIYCGIQSPNDESEDGSGHINRSHPPGSRTFYGPGVKQQCPNVPVYYVSPKKKKSINLEEIVGKYLVGTIASLLVFIAAVCLVAAFWTLMSGGMKFAVILFTGLGLAGGAYYRMWSVRKINVPWTIVMGIGVGLVYIALIARYVSFNLFGELLTAVLVTAWSTALVVGYKPIKSFFVIVIAYLGSLTSFVFILTVADGIQAVVVGAAMGVVLSTVMLFIAKTQLHGIHQLVSAALCSWYPIILAVRMSTLRNITDAEELMCNVLFSVCIYALVAYIRYAAEDFRWARAVKNVLSEIWLCVGAVCIITTLKSVTLFSDSVNLTARITLTAIVFLSIFITTFRISHVSTVVLGVYVVYAFYHFTGCMAGLGVTGLAVWAAWGAHQLMSMRVHRRSYDLSRSKQIVLIVMVSVACLFGLGVNHAKGIVLDIDKGEVPVAAPDFRVLDVKMNGYPLVIGTGSGGLYYDVQDENLYEQSYNNNDNYLYAKRIDSKYMLTYTFEMLCIILSSLFLVKVRSTQGSKNWVKCIKAWSYGTSWFALFWLAAFLAPDIRLLNLENYLGIVYLNWKPIAAIIAALLYSTILYCKGYFCDRSRGSSNNWRLTDKSGIVMMATDAVLYAVGLGTLLSVEIWYEHIILLFVMAAVIMKQSYVLIYNFRNNTEWHRFEPLVSLYLGLKYIIFIWALVDSFDIKFGSIVVSVVSMFVALVLIYSGFAIKMKTIRIYGLVIIILMALKIALYDLSASNGLVRILALGVGGAICLGVSTVYSNLNKRSHSGQPDNDVEEFD